MEVIPGQIVTFQALFVDSTNNPVVVPDAAITVFKYSSLGAREDLVAAVAMNPAAPVETGRYTYTWTVPSVLTQGDVLYVEMVGTYLGDPVRVIETVDVVPAAETLMSPGLRVQFVK